MNIELALIDIDDNERAEVYKDINEKIDNTLCIKQYSREESSRRLLHIGVKLQNINHVEVDKVLMGNELKKIELVYDKKIDYFYQKFDIEDEDIGINKAGFFKIFVKDKKDKLIYESESILVKPSIISEFMYKSMVKMLLNINNDLVMDLNSSIYLKGSNLDKDLSEKILNLINELEYPLKQINKNPSVRLIKEESKLPYSKIKKLNKKILLEKEMYPFKNKFTTSITVESKDTYENRALYSFLVSMKRCIDITIDNIERSINRNKREKLNILNVNTSFDINYKMCLNKKIEKISLNIEQLKKQKYNYQSSLNKIDEYMNFEIFNIYKNIKVVNCTLKLTQIFLHNEWYRRCYIKIKSFYEDNNFELDNLEDEELNVKEIYDIFEIWSYFDMVKIMVKEQGWVLDNKNLIRDVNRFIKNNNGSLYGFKVSLKHKLKSGFFSNENVTLDLIYNKTLNLDNKNLRPDFTFIITCRGIKKVFYLDAKYHNYLESDYLFRKDIEEVALNKYYNSLKFTEYSSSGSYILHCVDDNRYINFGHDTNIKHRAGSFSLTPENSNYFITWMSMIMEWIFDEYDICWNCGSNDVQEELKYTNGNKEKYHYTCNKCGSFWVKNHCICNSSNKLIKHDIPQRQYHEQNGSKWMVSCPICGEGGSKHTNEFSNSGYIKKRCEKCGGSGYIPMYNHIEHGVCFNCGGKGYIFVKIK